MNTFIIANLVTLPIFLIGLYIRYYESKFSKRIRYFLKNIYCVIRYKYYSDYYMETTSKFELLNRLIKRHDLIKFKAVVPTEVIKGKYVYKKDFFSGTVIGIDENKVIFMKTDNGDVIKYALEAISDEDFISLNGVENNVINLVVSDRM